MNSTRSLFFAALALVLAAHNSLAGYSSPGTNIQVILAGTVDNAALYMASNPTWTNDTPAQPSSVQSTFTLPTVGNIVLGRLVITVWGGSAARTNVMDITFNGTSLVGGMLSLGTTTDTNAMFSTTQPNVYGSGSGVWLVSLPVPSALVLTNGAANLVQINEVAPTFDGRIHHMTFISVYQNAGLTNQFQYAIAEGSGDIYASPTSGQTSNRTVALSNLGIGSPTAATLRAVYTYGDSNQNDRLYFNANQVGNDNIAVWNPSPTGLNFGPDFVTFDVLSSLNTSNNQAFFSVGPDVPGTRETSLRPQLAVLTVTGPAASTQFQQWQQHYFSCTTYPQAAPDADPDGDGMSNTNEFLAGTCPTNSAPAFHIVGIAQTNGDIQITWQTSGGDASGFFGQGKTNILEYTTGDGAGGFTNIFMTTGITNVITTLGHVLTNAIDHGGATNRPARYYRIRLLTP